MNTIQTARGRPLGRPLFPAAWRIRTKSYIQFLLALIVVMIAPSLVMIAIPLFDPPHTGYLEVQFADSRHGARYTLEARLEDGTTASAVCTRQPSVQTSIYRCEMSGKMEALEALYGQQLADRHASIIGSEWHPDVQLTPITPPWWMLLLQCAILAWWYRARSGACPPPTGRWLPWVMLPAVGHVLVTLALSPVGATADSATFMGLVRQQWQHHPLETIVGACLLAPVAEELFFRGVGWNILRNGFSEKWVNGLTAIAFGAIHGPQYGAWAVATLVATGYLLGLARIRLGSVIPCVIAHILINAFVIAALVLW